MAMTLTEAVKQANRVRDDSFSMRDWCRVFWSLAYCYAYGKQWGYQRRRGAVITAERLRILTDPNHPTVRVFVNHVRPAVDWLQAHLGPKRIDANLVPADGSVGARTVKFAGDAVLKRHLDNIDAVDIYNHASEVRLVMGTGIIRRTIQMTARRNTPGGRSIRDFRCGWQSVFPHEIIRDPAAATTNPGKDELIYGYEKPMSLKMARMLYPGVAKLQSKELETTSLGSLMDFQQSIQAAGSRGNAAQSQLSNEPGIVVYEFYFKDDSRGPGWHWRVPMFSIHPPGGNRARLEPLMSPEQIDADKPLPNPFQPPPKNDRLAALGLPFHHFNYQPEIIAPWGSGVPHILMPGQDLFNMGITWYARMQQQGGGKIVVEDGTVERPNRQFSNRTDMVIRYRRRDKNSVQPYRLDGPALTPGSQAFVDQAPGWIEMALNRVPVQQGVTSKRGEAGSAITAKLEAAGAPLEKIRDKDTRGLQDLIWATYLDMANPKVLRPAQAREIVGPDIPEQYIFAMLREHPVKTTRGVKLLPGVLRPKTPEQESEEFLTLAAQGVIDAVSVQRELSSRGIAVNSVMMKNIEKQTAELASMIHGDEANLAVDDDHETHRWVVKLLVGSAQWLALDEEVQERIEEHSMLHLQTALEASSAEAQLLAASQTPPAPSPPSAAFGQGRQQAGAVTPAL